MLDKKRIRLMSKTAMYEKHHIREDLKISSYYKKDYSSMNTLITLLWTTVGYLIIAAIIVFINLDSLLKDLTVQKMVIIVGVAIASYLIVLIVYGVSASSYFSRRHTNAKQRVKKYYRDLNRLSKMIEKEKKNG